MDRQTQSEILNSVMESIFIVDNDNIILFSNSSLYQLLETDDDLTGRSFLDFVPLDYRDTVNDQTRIRKKGASSRYELKILTAKNNEKWVSLSVSPRMNDLGTTIGALATVVDITKRKKMELELAESEMRFRDMAECSADWLWETDKNGRYVYCSQNVINSLGYSADEVVGKTPFDFMLPENVNSMKKLYINFLRKKEKIVNLENKNIHRNGDIRIFLTNGVPIIDEEGNLTGYRGVDSDITKRKHAEEEIIKAQIQTDKKNVELEVALSIAEELSEKAEMANISKSNFLANMSHEIRTPMNGIIGMTELLLTTELSSEQSEYTRTIKQSADSLMSIINDILDFSKIEAGKLELEEIDFDLRTMLDDIIKLISIQISQKDIELLLRVDPETPSLLTGDPGRIRQIITNLLGNAVKFTSHGEILLDVNVVWQNDTKALLKFSISDTGIGIDSALLDSLFKPFTQADSSTTRKYGGTGLGLTISKQLAKLLGGEIGAESITNKGSTFWFTAEMKVRTLSSDMDSISIEEELDLLNTSRILIVDDNATNRTILAGMLENWGCRHGEANSGNDAIFMLEKAYASNDPYNIAVLDMQMPDMNGEILGRKIKANRKFSETLLMIMYTSLATRGDAAKMYEAGFSAFLTKPVTFSQFRDCLLSVLKNKHQPDDTRRGIVTKYSISESKKESFRILLAEDNPVNRMVALKILEKLGYCAHAVENGREAIEELQKNRYDLVFMDIQMPEMDGLEATMLIRNPDSDVLDHDIPVIAMTAHAMKGDRDKGILAGMNDYITKPVHPDNISEKILAVITEKIEQETI